MGLLDPIPQAIFCSFALGVLTASALWLVAYTVASQRARSEHERTRRLVALWRKDVDGMIERWQA